MGLLSGKGSLMLLEDSLAPSPEEFLSSWEINPRLLSALSSVFYILDFQMKMVIVAIFAYNSPSFQFTSVRTWSACALLLALFTLDYFLRLSQNSVHSLMWSVTL